MRSGGCSSCWESGLRSLGITSLPLGAAPRVFALLSGCFVPWGFFEGCGPLVSVENGVFFAIGMIVVEVIVDDLALNDELCDCE